VEKLTKQDWKANECLPNLASILNKKLYLSSTDKMKLECFVDADWAGDRTEVD